MLKPYYSEKRNFSFLILLFPFLFFQLLNAQKQLSSPLVQQLQAPSFDADKKNWKEIPEKRTLHSSTYLTPDGRTIIQHCELPLNYDAGTGMLVPVVTNPELKNGEALAQHQPYPVRVDQSGAVHISQEHGTELIFSGNARFNGLDINVSPFELMGEKVLMKNIAAGVDKEFDFRYNGLEYNYILNNKVPLANGADLIIEEEMVVGKDKKIVQNELYGHKGNKGWLGALLIEDEKGNECGRMRGAVCYDADKQISLAEYVLFKENGKQKIKIIVSGTWLNDPARKYPLTIDPLVTGPTANWGGGQIASCLTPALHADSILVTIPAQITVTAFYVNGSYYADPFTTTVMADGRMYFATSCDTSQLFTVSGTTGTSPGTGYLTLFDLRNPLMCCWPQSCNQQTFYLRMLLGRTQPGVGCNTTYLYHDPLGGYPFSAYVEGHTVESWSAQWNVTPTVLCSNVCSFTATTYARYGVPPYTITHPWMTGTITAGTALGCNFGNQTKQLTLINPNCPLYCDTVTQIAVPPPTITDACGNVVSGMPTDYVSINQVPTISATPSSQVNCSGEPYTLTLTPCIAGSNISWSGNGSSGTSASISDTIFNTGSTQDSVVYTFTASHNGCVSAPATAVVKTDPLPAADFAVLTAPAIVGLPVNFSDMSNAFGGTITAYAWSFGDGTFSTVSPVTHTYTSPGTNTVCLAVITANGCKDTICKSVDVIPAEIVIPNIITPNGDNVNDVLYFQYLEFFGTNNLKVFNRWGNLIFEKNNYTNDWNANGANDGTYYFILTTQNEKVYKGSLTVVRGK